MATLLSVSRKGNRLDQLIELRKKLAKAIDKCESMRDLASLSKQYRDTIKEIEEIEGGETDDDDIDELLNSREADGKAGAVRPNRSGIH